MANNKMLIDASHPEETRVAVVRGNRIEEFDFESLAKKQLRGNIYLAKVTRVEPSLQAAFVDYGGNRHGFLAFSEIHPDYYQIPLADRQALLEEEASLPDELDEEEDEEPRRRRRRSRRSRDSRKERNGREIVASRDSASETESEDYPENDEDVVSAAGGDEADDDSGKIVAAVAHTDSISEPAPAADNGDEEGGETDNSGPAEAVAEEAGPARKPRRKRRPGTKKAEAATDSAKSEAASKAESDDGGGDSDQKSAKPRPRRTKRKAKAEEVAAPAQEEETVETAEIAAKPDTVEEQDDTVESVGQEDALEELPTRRKPRRDYKIQEVIKRRQIMLVQVVKEERGNKGAALTTYLSLAGRYSVLMPNTARGGGISRKITSANDRKRLKSIASELDVQPGMGVILRTAGASRTKAEVKRDFEYLMRLWESVRALTLSSTAPCLVYEEGSLIKRSIRDLYNKDITEILVSGDAGYREAKDFMRMLMPSHAKNVQAYGEDQAIFSKNGVEQQLDRLLSPQVTLKSGGYVVMNQTEALVSIDVNSGRSTREHSIEDTALQTNLEASDEIARQLRLRDLAGLIVIDFIDMEEKKNNRSVEKRLKDALKNDRARIQVGRISHFGLLEMSRQRIRASVMESTMKVCPHCDGSGHVRSESSIALHIFRSIEEHLMRHSRHDVIVRCPTSIAIDILNAKRTGLLELEQRHGIRISIESDPSLPGQSFSIERGNPASVGERAPSHVHPGNFGEVLTDTEEEAATPEDEDAELLNDEGIEADEQDGEISSRDGQEDDRPRRKRRRGRRGGRRNRQEIQGESGSETVSETAGPVAAVELTSASEPENSVPELPADLDITDEEPMPAQSQAADADPERRGRATRRPREKVGAQHDEDQGDTVTATKAKSDEEPVSDGTKPKKRGWWSRGGGFF
jgi:ribonuclease E